MPPEEQWLRLYEKMRRKTWSPVDFTDYFTEETIAGKSLGHFSLGPVSFPSGQVLARDPLVYLLPGSRPYLVSIPPGEYEAEVCVVLADGEDCHRYAAVRVCINDSLPVYYEEALTGVEDLEQLGDDEYFGFNVEAGLACITDLAVCEAYCAFVAQWQQEHAEADNIYDGYFARLFADSYLAAPEFQRELGDWIQFQIPGTPYHLPMFQSGFGDGAYPVYFGYAADGSVCQIVIHFIDIELAYGQKQQTARDYEA